MNPSPDLTAEDVPLWVNLPPPATTEELFQTKAPYPCGDIPSVPSLFAQYGPDDIGMWVEEQIFVVLRARLSVEILAMIERPDARRCHLVIKDVPANLRPRIRDVLLYTGMEEIDAPSKAAAPFAASPTQIRPQSPNPEQCGDTE